MEREKQNKQLKKSGRPEFLFSSLRETDNTSSSLLSILFSSGKMRKRNCQNTSIKSMH
jgi:hypothetical protein